MNDTFRPQPEPAPANHNPNSVPPAHTGRDIVVIVAVLGLFIGGYAVLAQKYGWWPLYVNVIETTAPTSEWNTYTNQEFGFQVRYPGGWHSQECRDEGIASSYVLVSFGDKPDLVICNSDAPLMGYATIGASNEIPSQQEIQSTYDNLDNATLRNIIIDGQPATRVEGKTRQFEDPGPEPGLNFVIIYTSKNGVGYRFIYTDVDWQDYRTEFDEVISTFRFINSADISSWKTYTNTQYGFEFRYPADAFLQESEDIFQLSWRAARDNVTIIELVVYKAPDYVCDPAFKAQIDLGAGRKGMIGEKNDGSNFMIILCVNSPVDLTFTATEPPGGIPADQILSTFRFIQ